MSNAAQKLSQSSTASKGDESDVVGRINSRKSEEIIIAFSGAVGCNLSDVIRAIRLQFEEYGYHTVTIKVSDIIKRYFISIGRYTEQNLSSLSGIDRYTTLQDLGNELRRDKGARVLASLAMADISTARERKKTELGTEVPPKIVYFVDQFKNPAEVELFKLIYGNVFYLVGVLSPQQVRFNQLVRRERISAPDAQSLIERDRNEEKNKLGQRLEKTIQLADFFIRNNHDNIVNLAAPCHRFVGLVHGRNGITPTRDESGMYAAFSASLKSACLSRQVGAAISDDKGNVVSLGWNDVPKFGGGLYVSDDGAYDQRCVNHGGKCYNDIYKSRLVTDIVGIVEGQFPISKEVKDKLAGLILEETRAGSIIEYSRAIHAEMEAILGLARNRGVSTDNCTLYTTTYPCHNCARHIIAAGIGRVVYIEPYEKSLAMDLHEDAISVDAQIPRKTLFDTFEGASPKKYSSFFFGGERKTKDGVAIDVVKKDSKHIAVEFLDTYHDLESKVVQQMVKELGVDVSVKAPITSGASAQISPRSILVTPAPTPIVKDAANAPAADQFSGSEGDSDDPGRDR